MFLVCRYFFFSSRWVIWISPRDNCLQEIIWTTIVVRHSHLLSFVKFLCLSVDRVYLVYFVIRKCTVGKYSVYTQMNIYIYTQTVESLKIARCEQMHEHTHTHTHKNTHTHTYIYIYMCIYIYIYIVIHRQICFVLSELIRVARQYLPVPGIETRLTQTSNQSF